VPAVSEPVSTTGCFFRVMNLALGLDEPESLLRQRACEAAGIDLPSLRSFRIARKSLDARRSSGGGRHFRFVVHANLLIDPVPTSETFERALRAGRIKPLLPSEPLALAKSEIARLPERVAVVGAGPAGLFAALSLAESGCSVDVVERGGAIRERGRALAKFLSSRVPDPESNLLFGEGGAGTYSDGKLHTRVDHPLSVSILEALVACGASEEIVYDARAHIGTDKLHAIIPALRARLVAAGVRFHWDTRLEGFEFVDDGSERRIRALRTSRGEIPCDAVFLAIGHSARDTWEALYAQGVEMEARSSQLGVRIEHPQKLIDAGRYGDGPEAERLGAAYYGLVCRAQGDVAGGYSFCMCPGGQIVASVNTPGHLCTNGMSNSRHSSPWANAAIVTPVGPRDFGPGVFAGVDYQRELEARFFEAGGGDYHAPAQRASDFLSGCASGGNLATSYKFGVTPARIDTLLPESVRDGLRRALHAFDRQIPGFAGGEGVLVGVETRCSAPLRIPRGEETFRARGIANLYPIGEGAGYAGGILSAAIDGARAAHALLRAPAQR
jgi:uncharacterized FAD-dependent dehydrogenase